MSVRILRYSTRVKTFRPVRNHLTKNTAIDGCVFLCDGKDLEFVRTQPANRVWTFIVSDEGTRPVWLIAEGFHFVNAMGYLLTHKPFETETIYSIRY